MTRQAALLNARKTVVANLIEAKLAGNTRRVVQARGLLVLVLMCEWLGAKVAG